jgi:hypothetical protein
MHVALSNLIDTSEVKMHFKTVFFFMFILLIIHVRSVLLY